MNIKNNTGDKLQIIKNSNEIVIKTTHSLINDSIEFKINKGKLLRWLL